MENNGVVFNIVKFFNRCVSEYETTKIARNKIGGIVDRGFWPVKDTSILEKYAERRKEEGIMLNGKKINT